MRLFILLVSWCDRRFLFANLYKWHRTWTVSSQLLFMESKIVSDGVHSIHLQRPSSMRYAPACVRSPCPITNALRPCNSVCYSYMIPLPIVLFCAAAYLFAACFTFFSFSNMEWSKLRTTKRYERSVKFIYFALDVSKFRCNARDPCYANAIVLLHEMGAFCERRRRRAAQKGRAIHSSPTKATRIWVQVCSVRTNVENTFSL